MNDKIGTKVRLWIITELFPPDEKFYFGRDSYAMAQKYDVGVICGPRCMTSVRDLIKTIISS